MFGYAVVEKVQYGTCLTYTVPYLIAFFILMPYIFVTVPFIETFMTVSAGKVRSRSGFNLDLLVKIPDPYPRPEPTRFGCATHWLHGKNPDKNPTTHCPLLPFLFPLPPPFSFYFNLLPSTFYFNLLPSTLSFNPNPTPW
jgi:hypothetical protein